MPELKSFMARRREHQQKILRDFIIGSLVMAVIYTVFIAVLVVWGG
jgi:hypothetical protein